MFSDGGNKEISNECTVYFNDIKKSDFDLIFFHTEDFPFKIVQTACGSRWCHIALVLLLTQRDINCIRRKCNGSTFTNTEENVVGFDDYDGIAERGVYILESTTDTYPCAITGKTGDGVKLCLLKDRLPKGDVCGYKSVSKKKIDKKKANKHILLYELMPALLGIPYERNLINLVKAWTHWLGCCYLNSYDESSMFCTELITHVFTRLGVLKARHRGGVYADSDYTDEDLVLEDYVFLETKLLSSEAWLSYKKLVVVTIEW